MIERPSATDRIQLLTPVIIIWSIRFIHESNLSNIFRDLEDFYAEKLRNILPPSSITRQLIALDPLIVNNKRGCSGDSNILQLIHSEFAHDFGLLIESLTIVARNSQRHGEVSVAERLLGDALSLMVLDDSEGLKYTNPNAVDVPKPLKVVIIELMLKCCIANERVKDCIHFGKVI